MVFKRPLLFLSLPSLAIVLGLVWFRRKRSVHCDTGGINTSKNTLIDNANNKLSLDENTDKNCKTLKHSNSLPIANNTVITESIDTKLGKSAPIDIIPNRSPPFKPKEDNTEINPDLLTSKIKDTEFKTLKSIEEQEDCESISPIDLPDSVERRRFSFSQRIIKQEEEPIVIKASMAAKVSPKNSFAENKYTEECVDNNNKIDFAESRDSANHSPIDRNLSEKEDEEELNKNCENPPQSASPPLSLCSHHSSDSGKGSSPPHSEATPISLYDFLLPHSLVGHLIGRKGNFVNQIKNKTGATVIVKKLPQSKNKICSIEGTPSDINAALKLIRSKLPEKRYPQLTLEQIQVSEANAESVDSACLRLELIEGINNDVIVSTIASGNHLFLQQPLHPSYPSLNMLQEYMVQSYTSSDSPAIPDIFENVVCVAPVESKWYRVQVVSCDAESQLTLCKYLDFGGFCNVTSSDLRQIRTDFMTVPFQSIECILSNVKPVGMYII